MSFRCEITENAFAREHSMENETENMKGFEKPFECEVPNKDFLDGNSIAKHEEQVYDRPLSLHATSDELFSNRSNCVIKQKEGDNEVPKETNINNEIKQEESQVYRNPLERETPRETLSSITNSINKCEGQTCGSPMEYEISENDFARNRTNLTNHVEGVTDYQHSESEGFKGDFSNEGNIHIKCEDDTCKLKSEISREAFEVHNNGAVEHHNIKMSEQGASVIKSDIGQNYGSPVASERTPTANNNQNEYGSGQSYQRAVKSEVVKSAPCGDKLDNHDGVNIFKQTFEREIAAGKEFMREHTSMNEHEALMYKKISESEVLKRNFTNENNVTGVKHSEEFFDKTVPPGTVHEEAGVYQSSTEHGTSISTFSSGASSLLKQEADYRKSVENQTSGVFPNEHDNQNEYSTGQSYQKLSQCEVSNGGNSKNVEEHVYKRPFEYKESEVFPSGQRSRMEHGVQTYEGPFEFDISKETLGTKSTEVKQEERPFAYGGSFNCETAAKSFPVVHHSIPAYEKNLFASEMAARSFALGTHPIIKQEPHDSYEQGTFQSQFDDRNSAMNCLQKAAAEIDQGGEGNCNPQQYHMNETRSPSADHNPWESCHSMLFAHQGMGDPGNTSSEGKCFECEICKKRFPTILSWIYHKGTHTREKQIAEWNQLRAVNSNMGLIKQEMPEDGGGNFECEICKETFECESVLMIHRRKHIGTKPFECEICTKPFAYKRNLTKHKEKHISQEHFKSDIHSITLAVQESMKGHFNPLASEVPLRCELCGMIFSSALEVAAHMKTHSPELFYECDVCMKSFNNKGNLIHHMRIHTGEKHLECDICNKSFAYQGNYVNHRERHVINSPLGESACHENFSMQDMAKAHMSTHPMIKCEVDDNSTSSIHGAGSSRRPTSTEKRFSCEFCSKMFASRKGWKYHTRTHTGEKLFKCEICKKTFPSVSAWNYHKGTHTGRQSFECDICNKTFYSRPGWRYHKRTHTGEQPYECEICKKTFSSKEGWNYHKRTHADIKPFTCQVCHMAFSFQDDLKNHLSTHAGEEPFVCEVCKKSFSVSENLENHMKLHSGKKCFECEVCKRLFFSRVGLKYHMRSHTGEKPFECDICKRTFSSKLGWSYHRKTHMWKPT